MHTFDYLINLIYPPKCIFCGGMAGTKSQIDICSGCMDKVPWIYEDYFPLEDATRGEGSYNKVLCACEYTGMIKEAIVRYKFYDHPQYYKSFARLLATKVKRVTNPAQFDIIISVPLHKEKERIRGYNQSYLLSRQLSRELGVKENSKLLIRVRNTESQSLLAKTERQVNIKGAFKVTRADEIQGKGILLVDDVLTTGSTLQECIKVLKLAGAQNVISVVIASGRKY